MTTLLVLVVLSAAALSFVNYRLGYESGRWAVYELMTRSERDAWDNRFLRLKKTSRGGGE